MSSPSFRRAVKLAGASLLAAGALSAAHAAGSCPGTIQGSLLHPLPSPLTIGGQRSIADTANPQLSGAFASGLQQAGIAVSDQANTTLSIAVSVSASSSGLTSGNFRGFDWAGGEPVGGRRPSIRNAALSISVVLTDNAAATQSWVATITCKVQTDDAVALAQYVGTVVGRAVGQNFDRRAM